MFKDILCIFFFGFSHRIYKLAKMFSAEFALVKINHNYTPLQANCYNIIILYKKLYVLDFFITQYLIKIYSKNQQIAPGYNIIFYGKIL